VVFYSALRTLTDYSPSPALAERQVFYNCSHGEVLVVAENHKLLEFHTNALVDNLNDSHNEPPGENLAPDTFVHKVTLGASFAPVLDEDDWHIVGTGHNLASAGD